MMKNFSLLAVFGLCVVGCGEVFVDPTVNVDEKVLIVKKEIEEGKFDVVENKIAEVKQDEQKYIVVEGWTPIFGKKDIGVTLSTPGVDSEGSVQFWREGRGEFGWEPDFGLQFVAHENTIFEVLSKDGDVFEGICVTCGYDGTLFFAPKAYRFVSVSDIEAHVGAEMPLKEQILARIDMMVDEKIPYGWGGNVPFEVGYNLADSFGTMPEMYGVDCSGMMYYATNGLTPRNTSEWLDFGTSVGIEGKTVDEIVDILEPLDVLVWKGHMMVFLSEAQIVESRFSREEGVESGMQTGDAREVLRALMDEKTPLDVYQDGGFVVRRFLGI